MISDYDAFSSPVNMCGCIKRGYDPALPPLRHRFAFALEFENNGTPALDLIMGWWPIEIEDARDRVGTQEETVADLEAAAPARC